GWRVYKQAAGRSSSSLLTGTRRRRCSQACRVCARLLYAHERCTYADGEISDLAIRGSFSSEYKRHTPDLYLCLSSRTVVPLQYTRGPATRCTGSSVLLWTDLQSVPRM